MKISRLNKVLLVLMLLFSLACTDKKRKSTIPEIPKITQGSLIRTNEYIDMNDNDIKLLFKAPKGSTVEVFLGIEKNNLELIKKKDDFQNTGLIITGLEAKQKYYYKVRVNDGDKIQVSKIESFTKMNNTNNWQAAEWAREAIFYEVFVRSFYDGSGDGIGDFKGLKEKIDYFKELGVDALWLMPINDSPSYHGYDVVDYYDTHKDYGTLEDFKEFLEIARENDIRVIIDLVVNHSSSEHEWFIDAAKDKESKYRDYYVWLDEYEDKNERGGWGQPLWVTRYDVPDYYYAVFWDGMPDLNFRNPKVREEMIRVAKYWLELGVDGFRLDAALHLDDHDADVTHKFWQQFNSAIKAEYPDAFLVGENWADTDTMASFFADLDSSFNFSLADALIHMANGNVIDILEGLDEIYSVYRQYSENFIDSTFLRNHDQWRTASELGGDKEKIKLAASLLLTLPGTPFIYYGEEIGQLGKKPDENLREPMDWYKSAAGPGMTIAPNPSVALRHTYANDGISVEEQRGVPGSIFEH